MSGEVRTMLHRDTETLNEIWAAMNGAEWNSDLWDVVAGIILAAGRPAFDPPEEYDEAVGRNGR